MTRSLSTIARNIVVHSRPALQGLLFGLLAAILLIAADQLSIGFGLRDSQRIVDDLLGGMIAGFAAFGFARVKTRYMTERLNTVALMNHHIRNALQVIRCASYIQPETQKIAEVEDAISRIDWALREVLPGNIVTFDEGWKHGSQREGARGLSATSHNLSK